MHLQRSAATHTWFHFAQMQCTKQKYSNDQAYLEMCAHTQYVNTFKVSHT